MDSRDNELYVEVMQVATMGFVPMALKAAIDLNVINIIARAGPKARLSAAEIAEKLPSKNPDVAAAMLERILQVLASHSVLLCEAGEGERRYGLLPLCKFLVPNEDGLSLSPFVTLILDKVFQESW